MKGLPHHVYTGAGGSVVVSLDNLYLVVDEFKTLQ